MAEAASFAVVLLAGAFWLVEADLAGPAAGRWLVEVDLLFADPWLAETGLVFAGEADRLVESVLASPSAAAGTLEALVGGACFDDEDEDEL